MLVLAVIGILGSLALPAFNGYRERARAAEAVTTIGMLSVQVKAFRSEFSRYPNQINQAIQVPIGNDPWGNPYQYLNIQSGLPEVAGKRRKDKNLVPINSDFDLYSMGPDGQSKPPLTNVLSKDDIVRAADGAYIGIAEKF